jgi:hypothetical protein
MGPEHIIDERATIKGADIEKVYDECVSWLKNINATQIENDRPEFIKAIHNPGMTPREPRVSITYWALYPRDWKKTIEINLETNEGQVNLRASIGLPTGFFTSAAIEKRRRWWIMLVLDLFEHLHLDVDNSQKRAFFPYMNLRYMITDIWSSFALPLIGSIIFWVWGYITITNNDNFGYFLLLAGVIGPIRVLYHDNEIRKRIRELHPDR